MLIAFIILASLFAIAYACGITTRDGLRSEVQRLRELLARITGERDKLQENYDHMRGLAGEALKVAQEKHFPVRMDTSRIVYDTETDLLRMSDVLPSPDTREVKNCPRCYVAQRSGVWPVKCLNERCQTWYGDELDAEDELI